MDISDISAKDKFNAGSVSEISMKLTAEHDQPVYTQNPPTPIH